MVIYNGREMASRYVRNNKIVEINSPIADIGEAITKIKSELAKEEPDFSDFSIHSYKYSDDVFAPINKNEPEWNKGQNTFDRVLTQTEYEVLADTIAVYHRPVEFVEFEKDQFNQSTKLTFTPVDTPMDEVLDELVAGYGILPTLWNVDKPISELKALSTAGENLVRPFTGEGWGINKFNAAPPLTWIEMYQKLSPYEKRVVTSGAVHPAKILQISKLIKDVYASNNRMDPMLRQEEVDYIISNSTDGKRIKAADVAKHFTEGFAEEHKSAVDLADSIFKSDKYNSKFHRHAPMVLSEYVEGNLAIRGISPEAVTEEQMDEIVSAFNQSNVSKIAKYRNPALLGLSTKIDFSKQRDNIIQAMGALISTSMLKQLDKIGFPEWINEHPDVKPEEMLTIVSKRGEINRIDTSFSPQKLLSWIKNKRGYDESLKFEKDHRFSSVGYKFENNELAIKGRHIVAKQGNLTMRMLPADDYANFTIGIDTHCCQRYGDAGNSCVYKYTSDPFAGAVVIERGDKVVAQGFVWVDVATDTFVFDNVELDNDREVQQFSDLFAAYAKALPYANVHVGTGYNQGMNGWGQKVLFDKKNPITAKMPTTVDGRTNIAGVWGDGNCYSDYHTSGGSVARVIKHMGSMKLRQVGEVSITTAPDEPTRWDELAKPDLCFMINDWQKPIDERLEIARQFRENPTDELQLSIVQRTPIAITSLEHPCREAQLYILNNGKDFIWKIKNPIPEIQAELIMQDPGYLRQIEHPSEEMILDVLQRDGMQLGIVENPTERECITAVTQNGYAAKYVPEELRTHDVQVASVSQEPKTIALFESPCDDAVRAALSKNPNVISLVQDLSDEMQVYAVSQRPSVINQIVNPCYEAVDMAIGLNGLMIRNFQSQYPELREKALRQNGFAIGCLKAPTLEESLIALDQNPNAKIAIRSQDFLDALVVNSRTPSITVSAPIIEEPEFV